MASDGCVLFPDGDLTDTVSGPRSTASDLTSGKASAKSPTQRHNPFNEDQAEAVSSSDTTPVHTTSQEKEPRTPEPPDAGTELEVIRSAGRVGQHPGDHCPLLAAAFSPRRQLSIFPETKCPLPSLVPLFCGALVSVSPHRFCRRVTKKKKAGKKKKTRPEEEANPPHPASAQRVIGARRGDGDSPVSSPGRGQGSPDTAFAPPQEKGAGPGSTPESSEPSEPCHTGLLIPEMKDTSMERLGQPLSKVIEQLHGQLDPRTWGAHTEPPDQPFRTGSPGDAPERPPFCDFSEGLPAPMDFYRFTVESPGAGASGGGNHDPAGPGQPLHVPGSPAAAGQEEEGGGGEDRAPPPLGDTLGEAQEPQAQEALCQPKRDQPSPCLSSNEDSGVEEGQGSPSEMCHSAEFR